MSSFTGTVASCRALFSIVCCYGWNADFGLQGNGKYEW